MRVAMQVAVQGVEQNSEMLRREAPMVTAVVVPRENLIEAVGGRWEHINSGDRCPRCSGLMVTEWRDDLLEHVGQRCVQCGELIDPVILHNRRLQQIGTSGLR